MKKLDLNLLRMLCVLIESCSVSYTSQYLNTSTSSVSYALNKLREHFSDPIMVRVKNGMQPTILALDIYNKIKPSILLIDKNLYGCHDEESTGKNLYHINSRTMLDGWLTNSLLVDNKLKDVNLLFRNDYVDDLKRLDALRRRQVDIDIGPYLPVDNAVRQYVFTFVGFDVVCRSNHPRLKNTISWQDLEKERVIGYSYDDIAKMNISKLMRMHYNGNIRLSSMDNVMTVISKSDYFTLSPKGMTHYLCEMYSLRKVKTNIFDQMKINFYCNILKSMVNDPFIIHIMDYFKNIAVNVT